MLEENLGSQEAGGGGSYRDVVEDIRELVPEGIEESFWWKRSSRSLGAETNTEQPGIKRASEGFLS